MKAKIAIIGLGQLGTRYLEGLICSDIPLDIFAYDISITAINKASINFKRLFELQKSNTVLFISKLTDLPRELDLAIIATTSYSRVKLTIELSSISHIKNWIFEKVLAQNLSDLNLLALMDFKNAWVNTPMYLHPLYKCLRLSDPTSGPINASFIGFSGLACNAIHYIDFVSRWGNSPILKVNASKLQKFWYESKRSGFFEIDGELSFEFCDNSLLVLRTDNTERRKGYRAQITTSFGEKWDIFESNGSAISNRGNRVFGEVLLQSALTKPLVYSILTNQKCSLPSLSESINQHKFLIETLLNHWNKTCNIYSEKLPVT